MKKITINIVLATLCIFFKAELSAAVIVSGLVPKHNNKLLPDTNKYKIRPLKIGDAIPETIWNMPLQVVNHPKGKQTITLNDYKGKLIILDFWATWCSGCIEVMPLAHELQKQFKNNMAIIGVTDENIQKVSKFTARSKLLQTLKPLSVVSDSSLTKYFPHRLIPHYVWIQSDGLVGAITDAQELTTTNVKALLKNKSDAISFKKEMNTDRPLFLAEDLSPDKILHYSILKKGVSSGLGGGTQTRQLNGVTYRRLFYNTTIFDMYSVTARELFKSSGKGNFNRNRLMIESARKDLILSEPDPRNRKAWEEANVYSYDLIVPLKRAGRLYTYLLDDLNRYLDFYGRIESRNMDCLLLVRKNNQVPIKPGGHTQTKPLKTFTALLNSKDFIHVPILNETGLPDELKLDMPVADTMEQLLKELRSIGLDLVPAIRSVEVFVIGDHK